MPLINCEVNLILDWSKDCVIIYTDVADQNPIFAITESMAHVPVVTLSTQDNVNLLPQIKSGFKRTIKLEQVPSKTRIIITKSKFELFS